MTYRCTFKNGDTRAHLTFEDAWALFMAYRHTKNPCALEVED